MNFLLALFCLCCVTSTTASRPGKRSFVTFAREAFDTQDLAEALPVLSGKSRKHFETDFLDSQEEACSEDEFSEKRIRSHNTTTSDPVEQPYILHGSAAGVALFQAVMRQDAGKVLSELDRGAQVDELILLEPALIKNATKFYRTALMEAVKTKNAEIVKILLSYGATPRSLPTLKRSPLFLAIDYEVSSEILRLLVDHGANINEVDTLSLTRPIELAMMKGNTRIFKLLLSHRKLDLNFVNSVTGRSLLHQAVYFREPQIVFKIFQTGSLNLTSKANQAAAFEAFSQADLDLTEAIIDGFGAENFNFDCCSWTPQAGLTQPLLHEAILTGRRQFVTLLASFEEASYVVGDRNAVALALQVADCEIIATLYEKSPIKFIQALIVASDGASNVLKWMVPRRNPAVMRTVIACLEAGGYMTFVSADAKKEAAFEAARFGYTELVEVFIRHGVEADARENDASLERFSFLEIAAAFDHADLAELLIEKYEVNVNEAQPCSGRTALHVAALHDSVQVARVLLEAGANFEDAFLYQFCAQEPRNRSSNALQLAERSGSHRVAELLQSAKRREWEMQTCEIFNQGL